MAATAYMNSLLEVVETVPGPLDLASNPTTRHRIVGCHGEFDADTDVPVTTAWSDDRTLTAGADALNLTSLARAGDLAAVDATGLKLQGLKVACPATNTGDVVLTTGATNGYTIGTIRVTPGGHQLAWFADGLADVASGARTIDVTSSDADAAYKVLAVFG
jgi:hypothetical protein